MSARFDWETIRAEYEAGATQGDLSRRHGCSRKAIQKRIGSEGWVQGDVRVQIARIVEEKVAGVVAGSDPKKRAKALEKEADKRLDVVLRQREEVATQKQLINKAIQDKDFDFAKLAKITAEALQIAHNMERKAWGLDIPATPVHMGGDPATQKVQVAIVVQPPVEGECLGKLYEVETGGAL